MTSTSPTSLASNTTTTPDGFLDGADYAQAGSLTYGIAVSAGILILIATITLASYYCTRDPSSQQQQQQSSRNRAHNQTSHPNPADACTVIEIGIDEQTLLTYPKMSYAKAKANDLAAGKEDSSAADCCSICLADYNSKDVVRLLPDCGHLFHQGCVDVWLKSHPTCPVCRTSPMPTPQSTPLAEVVPLAANRRN